MTERDFSGPLYPNQPLQEVAIEVRFCGRLKVERIRSDFQEAISHKYDKLFVPKIDPNVAPAIQHYRFESAEESCGVQLAINSISVYTRSYPGFEAFFAEVDRIFSVAFGLIGELNVSRVGWRYINAIPFPRENGLLPFGKIFQRTPWLTSALDGDWEAIFLATKMPIRGATANIRLAAGTGESPLELETAVFDIDVFRAFDPPIEKTPAAACLEMIDKMHGIAREIFESSISDEYRQFLLGDKI